jgi:hypothetical protein
MSDSKEKYPNAPPFDTLEEDAIIDLVDEIEDGAPADPISALEKQLLGISGAAGGQPAPASRLPDILDLSGIRFDEDDEAQPAAGAVPAGGESISLQEAQRLLDRVAEPDGRRPAPGSSNDIEEISEFEEQFLDPEEILDSKPDPMAAAQDEPPEILELDEAELDNELLWFDDLTKGDGSPAEQPAGPPEPEGIELFLPEDADLGPTTAADVFAAHLDSMFAEGDGAPAIAHAEGLAVPVSESDGTPAAPLYPPQPAALIPAVEAVAGPAAGIVIPAETLPPETPQPARIPPEEIEAAVERVIERKLGGTIEATVLRAIEAAVTREIERLKQLLLEDEIR